MKTLGVHHVGLAVSNLDTSTAFFVEVLGWKVARELPAYPARFVTNGIAFLTLWQTNSGALPFDRKQHVGLHHVAIRVESEADLIALHQRAATFPGVTSEFAPELQGGGPNKHCMLYEPSGVRIELVWAPAPPVAAGPSAG